MGFFCMALVEHVGDDSWYYLLLMVGGMFSLLQYILYIALVFAIMHTLVFKLN